MVEDAELNAAGVESEILDSLVESFALTRPSLVEEVIDEWRSSGAPPSVAIVDAAVGELLARGLLRTEEVSDEGASFSVVRLTDKGKTAWRRRNPLEGRLDTAWFADGDFIYAPSEEIARQAARELGSPTGIEVATRNLESWTYELDDTGDVIEGVRLEWPGPSESAKP